MAGLNGSYDGNARRDYLIPSLGWVRQIGPDLAIGIAAYGNGLGSSFNVNPYQKLVGSSPYIGTAGFSFEQFFLSPTVAYQIAPEHSIGASVNLPYQRFSAKGLLPFTNPGFTTDPLSVTNKGVDEAFGIGARIGYLGHITPRLSLGATYTTETFFQDFNSYRGLLADQGSFGASKRHRRRRLQAHAQARCDRRVSVYQLQQHSRRRQSRTREYLGAGQKLGSRIFVTTMLVNTLLPQEYPK